MFREENARDPALVQVLGEAGVSASRANSLARAHAAHVPEALRFLQQRRAAGAAPIRNPGGLLADFLEHPDKYVVEPEGPSSLPVVDRERREREQREAERRHETVQQTLLALPPFLRTILGWLRDSEWQAMEAQARAGVLSATTLVRETSVQGARGTLDTYLERLRGHLAGAVG